MAKKHRWIVWVLWSAVVGVLSAGVFLAVAELVALLFGETASPLIAVGSFVIDIVPRPLKEFAISTFGSMDKTVLLGSLALAAAVAAAVAGVLQYLRPPLGAVVFGIAGVLSGAAVLTRAGATGLSWIPTAVGMLAGAASVVLLVRMLHAWLDATAKAAPTDRRRFLLVAGVAAVGAVVVGAGARVIAATTQSLEGVREALRLPSPRTTVAVPAGAELEIDGLSQLFTPNADFYRVDTALTLPSLDPSTWTLKVVGMVDKEIEVTFQDLLDLGLDEYAITLTCVSNEVGGGLVGNAKWLGVPVRKVLEMASPQSGADMVLSQSSDGWTASTPIDLLTTDATDAILAVAMNGEPLPFEHGFPVRMIVPGLYGYVSATKWLTQLKVTTFAADQAYWTPRGYSAQAPIKFSSRIDVPRPDKPTAVGPGVIAGVAWAQTVGIKAVEVQIDGGDWQPATLATAVNLDTWVQWKLDWSPTAGPHILSVRATNAAGELQVQDRAPIAPDGSTGWQNILVTAA